VSFRFVILAANLVCGKITLATCIHNIGRTRCLSSLMLADHSPNTLQIFVDKWVRFNQRACAPDARGSAL
jgi:hypothetical protein